MDTSLLALSRLASTPAASANAETVVAACECVRALLGAEEAYVIQSGDPYFTRLGSAADPSAYEIKQRGYWYAWRELAANPRDAGRLLTVEDRLVEEVLPLAPGIPATHLACILPATESNSELLIVRGPWPGGVTAEAITALETARPLMAYLVGNALDSGRQERLRAQMRVLADIAEAFTQSEESENALEALATALSRASGFAWVAIILMDPALDSVIDRAVNVSRHSNTETAQRGREGRESENSVDRDIRVARHVAWTRQPYCVPDVADPAERLLVNDEVRPFYERAHILSMAAFPVFFRDQMLGTITFCASEPHQFDEAEQDFLWSLVAQAAPTIRAIGLNRDLRQAEQQLRAVFTNAPVFITVYEADGTIRLSQGAGLAGLGQRSGALVGRRIFDVMPETFHDHMRSNIERGMAGESFESALHINGGDFQSRYAPLRNEAGEVTGVIGVTMDVSEQYRAQRALHRANEELQAAKERAEELAERAEFLARHDALTGVLSRRAWFETAACSRPTAIAVLDIDRFKLINDRYGHPAGDAVLRTVAERICAALAGEAQVGRLGGEEFGILFHGELDEAGEACARAVEAVAAQACVIAGAVSLTVTVSAGLAPCRRVSDDTQDAIARAYDMADRALYEAKEAGRHRLVVSGHAA